MTRLINSNVTDMLGQINQYKKTVQDAFYEQYKNIYELIETNNIRGEGATAYKDYLQVVTINYINAFINISEEVSASLEKMNYIYTSLESSAQGSIDSDIIDSVKGDLGGQNNELQSLASEIDSLNSEASDYISVENLNTTDIIEEYASIDSELSNINKELTDADSSALSEANSLIDKINELTYQLNNISNNYHEGNKISMDKVNEITAQGWYKSENNDNLNAMIKEDPFFYVSGADYLSEGQWARGVTSDYYGYAGYKILGAEYKGSVNNGVVSGKINASILKAYANGQITDYAKGGADFSVGDLSAEGKAGASKDYFGFEGSGSASAVDANASLTLGTDEFNGYIKGNAKAYSANGNIDCYYKANNGDFNIGLGGGTTAAEASVTIGTSLFNVPEKEESKEYADGNIKVTKTKSLLGFNITGKAGESASAGVGVSKTRVLDFGDINIDSVNLKLGACLELGGDIDVTFPIPTIDMPWEN